jgi:hypothetical protein
LGCLPRSRPRARATQTAADEMPDHQGVPRHDTASRARQRLDRANAWRESRESGGARPELPRLTRSAG